MYIYTCNKCLLMWIEPSTILIQQLKNCKFNVKHGTWYNNGPGRVMTCWVAISFANAKFDRENGDCPVDGVGVPSTSRQTHMANIVMWHVLITCDGTGFWSFPSYMSKRIHPRRAMSKDWCRAAHISGVQPSSSWTFLGPELFDPLLIWQHLPTEPGRIKLSFTLW